jgi:hypothetical protein
MENPSPAGRESQRDNATCVTPLRFRWPAADSDVFRPGNPDWLKTALPPKKQTPQPLPAAVLDGLWMIPCEHPESPHFPASVPQAQQIISSA